MTQRPSCVDDGEHSASSVEAVDKSERVHEAQRADGYYHTATKEGRASQRVEKGHTRTQRENQGSCRREPGFPLAGTLVLLLQEPWFSPAGTLVLLQVLKQTIGFCPGLVVFPYHCSATSNKANLTLHTETALLGAPSSLVGKQNDFSCHCVKSGGRLSGLLCVCSQVPALLQKVDNRLIVCVMHSEPAEVLTGMLATCKADISLAAVPMQRRLHPAPYPRTHHNSGR
ncbi:hypothetical protein KUCAC02_031991 [Chaenocephalus aceratus]|nr:hypothetical protein KUCAC02_031991 [Chaenocephalus aceratus]